MMTSRFILLTLIQMCIGSIQHTNIIIIGGTGDLARKYLWSSALQLFVKSYNENNTIAFYAGARVPSEDGTTVLNSILDGILCETDDEACHELRPKFLKNAHYVMLKKETHYKDLCESFVSNENISIKNIFYFSIPSSAYKSVAQFVKENCYSNNITSTQIVLEKPFGLDETSAKEQVDLFNKYFGPYEVIRVDHYLAKSVTKQILKFRLVDPIFLMV